ncbi:hypothetical protein AHEV_236 [Adoxophyes honmai entomopoxvirus 'L']|uniref:Uncharacterized protein n=1 Tax=Adoxophyes honmai entomopoxvirus 'L' TaxID=1293540 RepID=A0A916NX88_9POXV|nr:hypothetical protein AHEV_236 [Adoxophyes honmai entomopoxvirus 'L']CCU55557.1 hypothetical protein AHEV_236 [Adoxophyes honmai entomopoxvirus 'L']
MIIEELIGKMSLKILLINNIVSITIYIYSHSYFKIIYLIFYSQKKNKNIDSLNILKNKNKNKFYIICNYVYTSSRIIGV